MPVFLSFPDNCSLLIQTHRSGREQAIGLLRAVMTRLFTAVPAGRVQFTIFDPVGLGENFAGFMHAADYQEALVNNRIWTDANHIQQRLADLTEHMENVIQKYLRNEFKTIEEYNRQAGELAEPYRFLVIADFPTNFNEETARRLASIIHSGPRCGVYTLIACDARQNLPPGLHLEDLAARGVHLVHEKDHFIWQDQIFCQFPLRVDEPPAEELITQIMHQVGRAARASCKVEVPFEVIAPPADKLWSADGAGLLDIPIGRSGATRLQHFRLGAGMAQHALIAGRTGSGKSTLLHVMITNLALWYSPEEIELYLIDFKRGVEFKTYVTHRLPHARAVAIESDREFGLSILQRLDAEMARRGELFRAAGVQDLAGYRQATGKTLPRTVLIVDEFQVFFTEDDRLAHDAAMLLEQLVRQGRAFGVHVVLGSQTLGGASGLARSTLGQMAVRIALQCSEADSQLILDDDNVAARLLSRPGEAIYNDSGGMAIGNSPFQTSWLADEKRDEYLGKVGEMVKARPQAERPFIVFEGNAPAAISENHELVQLLRQPAWPPPTAGPRAWLGEPTAIKEPTAVSFPRQSGANLFIVGQRETAALGIVQSSLLSLGMQAAPGSASFLILDGTPADTANAGALERVARLLPHESQIVEWREVPETLDKLAREVRRRHDTDATNAPAIYLMIYALQRYRSLRRSEEFSFSLDQEAPPKPDKLLAEILREGPPVRVHGIIWADSLTAAERSLERQGLREFDNLVLFQMSASDSSNLIDTPAANSLGFHRALLYSEEKGVLEKFRPYGCIDERFMVMVSACLKAKATASTRSTARPELSS